MVMTTGDIMRLDGPVDVCGTCGEVYKKAIGHACPGR
jgi:hypothetical protein